MEVNTEEENKVVVALAEAAAVSDDNHERDFWLGARETPAGWAWLSGAPMTYSNWSPDMGTYWHGNCSQLLKNGGQAHFETFLWVREGGDADCSKPTGDNGVICEMEGGISL